MNIFKKKQLYILVKFEGTRRHLRKQLGPRAMFYWATVLKLRVKYRKEKQSCHQDLEQSISHRGSELGQSDFELSHLCWVLIFWNKIHEIFVIPLDEHDSDNAKT